jgi:hypothetical protein
LVFENEGVLNPAAIGGNNCIHIFYRAVSKGNNSSIGYCKLKDPLSLRSVFHQICSPAQNPRLLDARPNGFIRAGSRAGNCITRNCKVDPAGQSSNFLITDLNSILDCHAGLDPASTEMLKEDFRIKLAYRQAGPE